MFIFIQTKNSETREAIIFINLIGFNICFLNTINIMFLITFFLNIIKLKKNLLKIKKILTTSDGNNDLIFEKLPSIITM